MKEEEGNKGFPDDNDTCLGFGMTAYVGEGIMPA